MSDLSEQKWLHDGLDDVIALARKLGRATRMAWRKEPPTVAGWYWWRTDVSGPWMTEVWEEDGQICAGVKFSGTPVASFSDYEWCGPLVPPP